MATELRRPKGAKLAYEVKQELHNARSEKNLSPWAKRTTLAQRKRYRLASKEKANASYKRLLSVIGEKQGMRCKICQKAPPEVKLTLDHVKGKTYRAKDLAFYTRVKRYWAEYSAGVKLRLLCLQCNASDGRQRQIEGRVHEKGAWFPKRPFYG